MAKPTGTSDFLLYGSYGYSGDLIAREAVRRGLRPLLAGRDPARLEPQAARLGLECAAFALEDTAALDAAVSRFPLALHCAGPFARTYEPMIDACLRAGAHYLDIAGEFRVFEGTLSRDAQARARGLMLMPAAGFDVVPTDCLAAHLKRRLPSATSLTLAFHNQGAAGVSRGTAYGSIEVMPGGARVRRGGRLEVVPLASKSRRVDFGQGPVTATRIIWGDVFTAYHSTGIPNIECYIALPRAARLAAPLLRYAAPLLRLGPVKALAREIIRAGPPGPSAAAQARSRTAVWGEASDEAGARVEARLHGPEVYAWTAPCALAIVERVLKGDAPPGYQTPARAYGADLVLETGDVTREDVV